MRRAGFALLALGCAAIVPAAPVRAGDCGNAVAQPELNACALREYEKADAELNRLYKRLETKLGGPDAGLTAAERAWIDYRDKECDFETEADAGGSIRPMEVGQCMAAKTEARIAELRKLLKCREDAARCGY